MTVAVRERTPGLGLAGVLSRILKRSPTEIREATWGIIFVSPWILGLILFTLGPIFASLYFSLCEYDILGSPKFIGVENYIAALNLGQVIPGFEAVKGDRLTYTAIGKTLIYAGVTVPIGTMGSLLLAILLNQGLKGTYLFRTIFFIPHLIPSIASVYLWKFLMHPRIGFVNSFLGAFGIPGPGWLNDPKSAMASVIIIGLWSSIGGNRMLIFLAGLQGVPQELYEAAELDGAGSWHRFWHVTLPMISPTVLFNVILGVIGALAVFTVAFAGTRGGPSYATWFFALHIYRQAFEYFRMGYGSALAWIYAVGVLTFTWLQLRASRSWVFYAGGN
ncbi:MAG TPA: sugar ABC transporter permease [Chloroflexi bacterium]|jgi:multiple sugar transport system permease protein|nr:sugar ABC transporter permease [Chloroflexota bacterium]